MGGATLAEPQLGTPRRPSRVKDHNDNYPPGSMHTGLKDSMIGSDLDACAKPSIFCVYRIYCKFWENRI
jgi:hypothetical protein